MHVRLAGVGDFLLIVHHFSPSPDRHLHIGLPGTEPYLSGIDFLQDPSAPGVGNLDLKGSAGFRGRNRNQIASLFVGYSPHGLTVPGGSHPDRTVRLSGDRQDVVALYDHAVGHERRNCQFSPRRRRLKCHNPRGKNKFYDISFHDIDWLSVDNRMSFSTMQSYNR